MFLRSGVVVLLLCGPAFGQAGERTVLDRVYSEEQASRGQSLYTALCAGCHGKALEGVSAPELTGNRFIERWREGTLDGIFNFTRVRMPPGRAAGAALIPDNDYIDILAYIIKANEYPAGPARLEQQDLSNVMFVGKNGPRPVPDGALVVTVGCLNERNNGAWALQTAAEPKRTRTEISSPEEIKLSSQKRLGTLTFRLAELDAVPDFTPETHKGHKIEVKGYLVRQPEADRISVSSMQMLAPNCEEEK